MFSNYTISLANAVRNAIPSFSQIWDAINPIFVLRELVTLERREHVLLGLMLTASLVAFAFQADFSAVGWVGLLTSVATALNLILVDRGRLTNFSWGIISSGAWLIVAFHNHLIGDISSQLFYFVAQFVGISVWHRSITANHSDAVESKKMTKSAITLTIVLAILMYAVNLGLAHALDGAQIYLDSTLLVLGVVGQILMTYGFRSQWVAWLALDVINVVIWSVQLSNGGAAAMSMLVLQVIMLVNGIYGAYLWFRPTK